jgi:hypothetical protein
MPFSPHARKRDDVLLWHPLRNVKIGFRIAVSAPFIVPKASKCSPFPAYGCETSRLRNGPLSANTIPCRGLSLISPRGTHAAQTILIAVGQ